MWLSFRLAALSLCVLPVLAQTADSKLNSLLDGMKLPGVVRSAIGVTRQQTTIPSLISGDDLDYRSRKTRILLAGGLDGSTASVDATVAAVGWFYGSDQAARYREEFAVSAVPAANPDGWAAGSGANGAGGDPTRGYPPAGDAYSSATDPEAAYLWRWIGMDAPDLVVEVRSGGGGGWLLPESDSDALSRLRQQLQPVEMLSELDALVPALLRNSASGTGSIPALQFRVSPKEEPGNETQPLPELLRALVAAKFHGPSAARSEIQRRLNRTPLQVAEQLSRYYGHKLDEVVYIPAVAVIGRLRLGELTNDASQLADAEALAKPYVEGEKESLPVEPSGSHFSGHLVFGELAKATGNPKYLDLARRAADFAFDAQGNPKEAMPAHSEMSDGVFMGCPILAQAGRLTGDGKYYDMAVRHMRFMQKLDLRPDGLYRHSPLDEAAWGRGNGFPALGIALTLSELPDNYPQREEMLTAFRAHLEALLPHQDPTGAWHEVIDFPGSYRELTATSMITFAMARGVRSGWLDEARFRPAIERGWYAIRTRVAADGGLVDVCTGTGKQRSLRDYLDRTAILGQDDRGGAMALLAATEMALWERRYGPLDRAVAVH